MGSTPFDRTVAMVYRKPVPELDAYQCPDYRQHILWVDYRLPLEPLRDELVRLCNAAPEWDHRAQVLQVTDTSERAMQLRVLVSSANSALNWDLRCKIREGLIEFI